MKEAFMKAAENKKGSTADTIKKTSKKIEKEEGEEVARMREARRRGEENVQKMEDKIKTREERKAVVEVEEEERWETTRTYYQTDDSGTIGYADQRSNGDPDTDAQVRGVDYSSVKDLEKALEQKVEEGKIKGYRIIEDAQWESSYSTPSGWYSPHRKAIAEVTL